MGPEWKMKDQNLACTILAESSETVLHVGATSSREWAVADSSSYELQDRYIE